jgi:hypothetical protein
VVVVQELQKTDYGERDLYALNFNDMAGSFVVLVACLHVSSWDTIAGGFSAVTSTVISRVYFTAWYCVGVLLLMKVITSFFISAFVLRLGGEGSVAASTDTAGNNGASHTQMQLRKRAVLSATLAEPLLDESEHTQSQSQSQPPSQHHQLHTMQSVIDKAESPQQQKYLSELSLRYSRTIDSVRHLRALLHDEDTAGESRDNNKRKRKKLARRTFSVNFSHAHGLKPEDMEGIVSRMGKGDDV